MLAFWGLWIVAALAGLQAASSAFVTYATGDYRPILIRGIWMSVLALIALNGTTLAARSWKGRVPGIVGMLPVLLVLREILERLAASTK